MYKVNESLVDQPMEIGRTRIFSRGWLENESIWMHMEYKYLLELLRSGLYAEFYKDFKTMLDPVPEAGDLRPQHPGELVVHREQREPGPEGSRHRVRRAAQRIDRRVHPHPPAHDGGRAAVPRWTSSGELELEFQPALPGWLFSREGRASRRCGSAAGGRR